MGNENITDTKPTECGGPLLRRTDSHIKDRSNLIATASGDSHHKFPMFNVAQTTTPDDDPNWGHTPCRDYTDG